jgi:hypothetical protein
MSNQFNLCCDFWSKDDASASHDQGSIPLKPIPLSCLQRIFGASRDSPWFDDGAFITPAIAIDLASSASIEFNHARYFYRICLYGDGKIKFNPSLLDFGVTKYSVTDFSPQLLILLNQEQKRKLMKLFKSNRLFEFKKPTYPLSIRLDSSWVRDFLTPIGIELSSNPDEGRFFFDAWFNV